MLHGSDVVARCAQAWRLSGDSYSIHPGDKPWISEMYGYIFAAAKHNMWHQVMRNSLLYPGYYPRRPPQLLHYGLKHSVNTTEGFFAFDKHWHFDFDPMQCPPWNHTKGHDGGVFPRVPGPDTLFPPEVRFLAALITMLCLPRILCSARACRLGGMLAAVWLVPRCSPHNSLAPLMVSAALMGREV